MAQVQKQLIASQKFLVGLVSLPQYGELRGKQLERLMAVTRKAKLTIEQSAGVLASVDSTVWDESSLSQLKSLVADQTVTDAGKKSRNVRSSKTSRLCRSTWMMHGGVAWRQPKVKRKKRIASFYVSMQLDWDWQIPQRKHMHFCMRFLSPCILPLSFSIVRSWVYWQNGSR